MKNLAKKGFLGLIIVMFLSIILVGCSSGLSKAELEKQVAASIEEKINAERVAYGGKVNNTWYSPFARFEVKKVTLIKKGENEYTGSATVICFYPEDDPILGNSGKDPVTVTETLAVIADKDSFQWKFE